MKREAKPGAGQSQATRPAAGGRKAKRQAPAVYGGYIRVSRVGERDERLRSPQFQASAIEAKASSAGVGVRMFKPELDVSGSTRERAVLDSIVEAIERGELAGIVVYNLKRLSRLKPLDRIELVERIESAGGTILSASESFDATTPEGRLARNLFFEIARMEWEQAAEGFAVAKANAIASGRAVMRLAPFGYRFDDDHALELVGEDAAIVRELFELRASGASYGDCLEHFERSTGRSSYRETIRYMLSNRVYIGELRYGREVELVNVGGAPAIVDEELFEAVQAVNEERNRAHGRPGGGKAKSLLAGIATCAGCGRGLVCTRTGSRQTYSYKCPADSRHCSARAHVQASELEAYVLEEVLEWAGADADELAEVEVELGARGDRVVAEHRLAEAEESVRRFAENLELEDADPTAYAAGLEARRQRVELRRAELAACGEASAIETARSTLRLVLQAGATIGEANGEGYAELELEQVDVEARRRLLAIVLDSVVVARIPYRGAPIVERASVIFADAALSTTDVLT